MTNHPDWYYKYYNKILAYGKDYDDEIDKINSVAKIKGKVVQEIGSGTGEHAIRLLHKKVKSLELLDFDKKALGILENKFFNDANVKVLNIDGFNMHRQPCFDIIICMYSIILLSINHLNEFYQRVSNLIQGLKENGYLFFEVVDYDICKDVYEDGSESLLFKQGTNEVYVRSRYSTNKLHFIYSGNLDGKEITYEASLLRITKNDIFSFLKSTQLSNYGFVELEATNRRILTFIKK